MKTKSKASYIYIKQNRLSQNCNKRQRMLLYNDKGVSSSREYNNCKYNVPNIIVSKHVKQILTYLKEEIDNNTVIAGEFNTLFLTIDISYRQI